MWQKHEENILLDLLVEVGSTLGKDDYINVGHITRFLLHFHPFQTKGLPTSLDTLCKGESSAYLDDIRLGIFPRNQRLALEALNACE